MGVVVGVGSCWICNGGGRDRFAMGVGVTDLQWGGVEICNGGGGDRFAMGWG